jgi:hypothetical protein
VVDRDESRGHATDCADNDRQQKWNHEKRLAVKLFKHGEPFRNWILKKNNWNHEVLASFVQLQFD